MKLNGGSPSTRFIRRKKSPRSPASPRSSSAPDSSKAARWTAGRIHVSNGKRGANGASATKPPASTIARRPPRRSWRRMSHHTRSEEHTSELQSQSNLVCRLLLEKKNRNDFRNQKTGWRDREAPKNCRRNSRRHGNQPWFNLTYTRLFDRLYTRRRCAERYSAAHL